MFTKFQKQIDLVEVGQIIIQLQNSTQTNKQTVKETKLYKKI